MSNSHPYKPTMVLWHGRAANAVPAPRFANTLREQHHRKIPLPVVLFLLAGLAAAGGGQPAVGSGRGAFQTRPYAVVLHSSSVVRGPASDQRRSILQALPLEANFGYSTYLGGTSADAGTGIAVDAEGNVYVTGLTHSTNFPTANALQSSNHGGADLFVAKFGPDGSLIYSTYLGGTGNDVAWAVAVDAEGSAYVAGQTDSSDFPLANPLQPANHGGRDVFVAKLSPSGSALVYSTYLGGTNWEEGWGIGVDAQGNAYVTGNTFSADFPTANAYQPNLHGGIDAFVARLNSNGSALVYSTYLGGGGREGALGIAVDASGSAYVTGNTTSGDFPTANAFQSAAAGGEDVFVTRLAPGGTTLAYSTYLGGSADDTGWAIAVDRAGSAYLTGYTGSPNFPTRHPFQAGNRGGVDGFVAKLQPSGSQLSYSSYLGGNGGYDAGYGLGVDGSGHAYVWGLTSSTDFPTVSPLQADPGGEDDAFLTVVDAWGDGLAFSTYLGGSGNDYGYGIAVSPASEAFVAGQSESVDFPVANPFQGANAGNLDVIAAHIGGACELHVVDVHPTDYFYEPMRYLYCAGVMSGYADNTCRPYNTTTRGQLSKIVVLAEGWSINTSGGPHFSDVPPDNPFYPYIETAYNRGVISGYADNTFRWGADITRGQLCKIIVLARGWKIDTSGGPHFTDVWRHNSLYDYIETAYNHAIISGYADSTFRPGNSAIRGQIARIVYNAVASSE